MKIPPWLEERLEPLRASPKKTGTLGVLVLILVGLWLKMMVGSRIPAAARAALEPLLPTTNNPEPAVVVHGSVPSAASLQEWARKPVIPTDRNLFIVSLDYFPRDGARDPDVATTNDGFWDRLAKSMSAKADQQQQRRILIDNIRIQAGSLNLQSTMMGSQPSAMVNGEMVREGSVVAGFRILRIEARKMIVEREGIKLEIVMK